MSWGVEKVEGGRDRGDGGRRKEEEESREDMRGLWNIRGLQFVVCSLDVCMFYV